MGHSFGFLVSHALDFKARVSSVICLHLSSVSDDIYQSLRWSPLEADPFPVYFFKQC